MRLIAALLFLIPGLAAADVVEEALNRHILPGFASLTESAAALQATAEADCTPASEPLRTAYHSAFDAWIAVSHLRFGPTETDNRAFALAFWPDTKGATGKALGQMIRDEDPVVDEAGAFREVSVAARGFYALEALIYGDFNAPGPYHCRLVRAIAQDIATTSAAIEADWRGSYAGVMLSAGEPGNPVYLAPEEAVQELFKSLNSGLEFISLSRLGRPLGSFDRPRPRRADAWRSGRSLRNVTLSLAALRDLAGILSEGSSKEIGDTLRRGFDTALRQAERLDDPGFAGVAEPQGRIRVEALKTAVDNIMRVAAERLGPALGVAAGFNSMDGD